MLSINIIYIDTTVTFFLFHQIQLEIKNIIKILNFSTEDKLILFKPLTYCI